LNNGLSVGLLLSALTGRDGLAISNFVAANTFAYLNIRSQISLGQNLIIGGRPSLDSLLILLIRSDDAAV
jgi:hypothetical protein